MKNTLARLAGSLVTVSAIAAITAPIFTLEAFAQNGGGGRGGNGGGRGNDGGGRGNDGGGRRMGGGMSNMMMPPSISNQIVERMEKSLALTPDQAVAAKELHDGYNDQARAIQEKLREQMESIRQEFQDTQDPTVWEKAQKNADEARAARKALDETFMSDYKLLLTPEQTNQWPSVERGMRRDQGLRRGFISGERVDVRRVR